MAEVRYSISAMFNLTKSSHFVSSVTKHCSTAFICSGLVRIHTKTMARFTINDLPLGCTDSSTNDEGVVKTQWIGFLGSGSGDGGAHGSSLVYPRIIAHREGVSSLCGGCQTVYYLITNEQICHRSSTSQILVGIFILCII